jgi:MFS family permease
VAARQRIVIAFLIGAVGLAFADASVVALALPDLYGEFDTSIVGVSWVLTTYALAVAITAIPVAVAHRRVRPLTLVVAGAAAFAASSVLAGGATSLSALLTARAAQGVGATLLLAGSLPVLVAVVPGEGRARRWWALAGAVGVAVGPALGGILTELFAWRAIFFVQAPVAAGALLVAAEPAARAQRHEGQLHGDPWTRRRDVTIANVGFALVFAALVAALFLGVLLAIEVWRYSPAESVLIVSALPLGMAVGRLLQAAPGRLVAAAGALLLALGLLGLALVPGAAPVVAAVAFAVCGVGFDLVHEVLDAAAVPADGPTVRVGAGSIGARHAGLVLGLAFIAPVLSSSLDAGIERATLGGTQTLLTSELPLSDKVPVAWALRNAIEDAPRGQVPDLAAEFDERGADGDNAMARARDDLMTTVTDAVTRSFRPAFAIAAGLATLAAVPAVLVARRRPAPQRQRSAAHRTWSAVGIGAVAAVAVALVAFELADGAADTGEFVAGDPCTAAPDPFPGDGLDASIQRIAHSTLNGAACELGTSRERLVLSLDPDSGYEDVNWDDDTLETALRAGAHRAIDDANDRDTIPGWAAAALGFVVDRAPIGWLVERLPIPGT